MNGTCVFCGTDINVEEWGIMLTADRTGHVCEECQYAMSEEEEGELLYWGDA